jgi:hypothetical protein
VLQEAVTWGTLDEQVAKETESGPGLSGAWAVEFIVKGAIRCPTSACGNDNSPRGACDGALIALLWEGQDGVAEVIALTFDGCGQDIHCT